MNLHLTDHQGAATEKADPLGEPCASMYLDVNTVKVNTEEVNVWRKKVEKKKVKI